MNDEHILVTLVLATFIFFTVVYVKGRIMTKKRILVIDDLRFFVGLGFDTYTEYLRYIPAHDVLTNALNQGWDEVWLDHDMGEGSLDGTQIVNIIEEHTVRRGESFPVDLFVIHTNNPAVRERMKSALSKYYNVEFRVASDFI